VLSVLSLVQAWVRVGLIPAVVYLLVAQIRPPQMGWPRQERSATIAAWLLVACVPVSGLARLGEIDVVLLAVASWIALGNSGVTKQRRAVLLALWVTVSIAMQLGCGTLVLTRISGCVIDSSTRGFAVGVVLLGWMALAMLWPRTSIPQRMTMIALLALGVENGRQVWALGE
jgi:hypothetical protein